MKRKSKIAILSIIISIIFISTSWIIIPKILDKVISNYLLDYFKGIISFKGEEIIMLSSCLIITFNIIAIEVLKCGIRLILESKNK